MTVSVTMLDTRLGENGSFWVVGQTYEASDAFASLLISSNLAVGALPKIPPNFPTKEEAVALRQIAILATYERTFPTWGGLLAGSIQFRGATDAAGTLGTLGLVLGASSDAEAAVRLAGNDADEISTINGSSLGGLPHLIELPAPVSDCHLGQIGMTAPYSLVTSGTVDAADKEFIRLLFPEPVNAMLWTEYSPTDYAGTPGTGSARLCTVVGLVAP